MSASLSRAATIEPLMCQLEVRRLRWPREGLVVVGLQAKALEDGRPGSIQDAEVVVEHAHYVRPGKNHAQLKSDLVGLGSVWELPIVGCRLRLS